MYNRVHFKLFRDQTSGTFKMDVWRTLNAQLNQVLKDIPHYPKGSNPPTLNPTFLEVNCFIYCVRESNLQDTTYPFVECDFCTNSKIQYMLIEAGFTDRREPFPMQLHQNAKFTFTAKFL